MSEINNKSAQLYAICHTQNGIILGTWFPVRSIWKVKQSLYTKLALKSLCLHSRPISLIETARWFKFEVVGTFFVNLKFPREIVYCHIVTFVISITWMSSKLAEELAF